MNFSLEPISSSDNAVLILLEEVRPEDIIEKKLLYFLKKGPIGTQILKTFFEPVEKAVIEFCLEKNCGNQVKTAQVLGINRNTLKKKIQKYNLNIQKTILREKRTSYCKSRVFVGSVSSLDLFCIFRDKLLLDYSKNKIPSTNLLNKFCRPIERKIIQMVLDYCKGNQIKSSHFLGINRNTLKKKMDLKSKMRVH
ncbi:MAG: hypothetical protein OXC37_00545 [Bdellovibrionaceae bacterium]|nr:hypothetical protein [Pseudobdellovibrionaceae bacterium]